jgi:hypothetical protein
VVFRDAKAFALIHFDLAKPPTRADEMLLELPTVRFSR